MPAKLTIIESHMIARALPRTASDVLGAQSGIALYDDLGSQYKLNLTMRGFGAGPTVGFPAAISVFIDGVRQNEADAQEVNFDLMPIEDVERIEILSGNASLLGPNSLGGAINLITRRGTGPGRGELDISGGSFGARGAHASFGGSTGSSWDYYGAAGYEREQGWRDATNAANYNAVVNVGRQIGDRGVLFQLLSARGRSQTAGSLPQSILDVSPRENFTPGDFEDLNAQQVSLSANAPVANARTSLGLYARRSNAERFNVNQPPDDNVRGLTENLTVGGNMDWRWNTTRAVALRAGVEAAESRVRVRIFSESRTPPANRVLTTDVLSPRVDAAGYFIADALWRRLTLSAGSRFDYVLIPFSNSVDTTPDTRNRVTAWTPRAGASLALGPSVNAYASVGRSFRAPAILELACADPAASCPLPFALGDDPPLEPVTVTSYEVGARWLAGPALLTGTVFRSNVRNEIFFVASDVALLSGYFTNVERTQRQGIELSSRIALLSDRLALNASYSITDARFLSPARLFSIRSDASFATSPFAGTNDVEPGDVLPLVPRSRFGIDADLRLTDGTQIGGSAVRIGKQRLRGDEANETMPLRPYDILNARISRSSRSWELSAVITNVLNSRRANFGVYNVNRRTGDLERFLTPADPRRFRFAVSRAIGHQSDTK